MANPLLEIDQLSVSLQKRKQTLKAVDNLSLKIYSGEILGLVGESGAGKSMTGSAILGLIDPPLFISSGKIIFEGERIDQNTKNIRGSKISMIFQDPLVSLNPLRRIGDQLVETIITHFDVSKTQAFERAKSLLEEVGIDPSRINAYPHTFSGGMRQRVVIALALAPEPALIIADEPTTALDVSVQAQILDLLKKLAKERGTAIILITHDMGVIAETTDRVAVLYSGRLAEIGKTVDVLKDPKHPYTKGLVASTPRIDANSLLE
ncbi:MAG: ABC transporter ATP-binding protein, partial [Proteobacteria bacterium]|nr:ABC transporter ATP-binding protein [Pseudomonadota bacterium]